MVVYAAICSICVFAAMAPASPAAADTQIPTVTLDVVRAFDPRLPALGDTDVKEILDETKRIVDAKIGRKIDLVFRDNGTITLDQLFKDKTYQQRKIYRAYVDWKLDISSDMDARIFEDEYIRDQILEFLKQWDLKSLKDFFPGNEIRAYEDAYKHLTEIYLEKVEWLKTLKTGNGTSVLVEPLPPHQSYVEWITLMREQDKYDIIVTNQLIVYDLVSEPYPHAITKHAKAGGSSFPSPKRRSLDGRSLMVSVIEEYGEIDGIKPRRDTPRTMKNRIIGGFLMAHELAHAFYLLPDVYDHSGTCLMNSSFEDMDYLQGYNVLVRDMQPCDKCRPWISAKEAVIRAGMAYELGGYAEAGQGYVKGAAMTPKHLNEDYPAYMKKLYRRAMQSFKKAGDEDGVRRARQSLEALKAP